MSGLINSYILEPALRQARRFSTSRPSSAGLDRSLSHASDANSEHALATSPDAVAFSQDAALSDVLVEAREELDQSHDDAARAEEGTGLANPPQASETMTLGRETQFQSYRPGNDEQSNHVLEEEPISLSTGIPDAMDLDHAHPASRSTRNAEARTLDSLGSMSIVDGPSMTTNPSYGVPDDLRDPSSTSTSSSGRIQMSTSNTLTAQTADEDRSQSGRRDGSLSGIQMSGHLPEDDGMRSLRAQVHQIREMALSTEEKAKRMHDLMTADYQRLRMNLSLEPTDSMSESSEGRRPHQHSPMSSLGEFGKPATDMPDGPFPISADDIRPTYQPQSLPADGYGQHEGESSDDEELALGCAHYRRNVKVQCNDCRKWYTCRHCHDEAEEDHKLNRRNIKHMLCMLCGHAQKAGEYCSQCGELTASHYCDICKLWDNDPSHNIYHCPDCGICRRGVGLGKDYIHCKVCTASLSSAMYGHAYFFDSVATSAFRSLMLPRIVASNEQLNVTAPYAGSGCSPPPELSSPYVVDIICTEIVSMH